MRGRAAGFHYKTNVFCYASGEISAILQRVTNVLLKSTYISTSRDEVAFSHGCIFHAVLAFAAFPMVKYPQCL